MTFATEAQINGKHPKARENYSALVQTEKINTQLNHFTPSFSPGHHDDKFGQATVFPTVRDDSVSWRLVYESIGAPLPSPEDLCREYYLLDCD